MAKLFVLTNFQFQGRIYRCGERVEDAIVSIADGKLEAEKALGKHPKTGRWLSPMMNHCEPADDAAAAIFEEEVKVVVPKAPEANEEEEVENVRAQFDAIGKAYDRRWGLERLRQELVKATKESGA